MTGITEKAAKLLSDVLATKPPATKWAEEVCKFGRIKSVSNTDVGEVGEEFAVAILQEVGYADAERKPEHRGSWDITANGKTLEIKCATEDANGYFQFNGVRHDRDFAILLLVGIAPNNIFFRFYWREELSELLTTNMAQNVRGNYKFTHSANLRAGRPVFPISDFPSRALEFLGEPRNSP